MLIYDRRRCRPLPASQMRTALSLAQRAKLGELEHQGWRLAFVRRETMMAFIEHDELGQATISRRGQVVRVRSVPPRP